MLSVRCIVFCVTHVLYSFILFNNYRIPKSCLLRKAGDVSPDGKYLSAFSSNGGRSGNAG